MFRKEYLRKCMKLKRKTPIKNYHNLTRNSAVNRGRGISLVVKRKKEGHVGRLQVLIAALRKVKLSCGMTPC